MSEEELSELQNFAIAAFAREIRSANDFVSLARILGVPKLREYRKRVAEIIAERDATAQTRAAAQPQFQLKST